MRYPTRTVCPHCRSTEQGDTEMVDLLTSAGAQMWRCGTGPRSRILSGVSNVVSACSALQQVRGEPKPYEAGRWTETQAKKKRKEKGKKGKQTRKK